MRSLHPVRKIETTTYYTWVLVLKHNMLLSFRCVVVGVVMWSKSLCYARQMLVASFIFIAQTWVVSIFSSSLGKKAYKCIFHENSFFFFFFYTIRQILRLSKELVLLNLNNLPCFGCCFLKSMCFYTSHTHIFYYILTDLIFFSISLNSKETFSDWIMYYNESRTHFTSSVMGHNRV